MLDENNIDSNDMIDSESMDDQNISEPEVEVETESYDDETQDQDTQSDESEDGESNDDSKDKNYETVDWVKKRLAQKDRQNKKRLREKEREIEALRTQVSAIYQPTQQDYTPPQGQIFDPATGQYVDEDSVEGKVILKLQQMQQAEVLRQQAAASQAKQKSLGSKIEELKDKYDDLEDVMKESYQNFTAPMTELMLNDPNTVETLYYLAKNNPQRLSEISRMSEFQQIKAINFLEFQKDTSVNQKLRSDAPKPVTPVKPSATNFVDKHSFDAIYQKQREEQRRLTGK